MGLKLIEGDDKTRVKKCSQRNEEILEKFDCYLIPEFLISGTLTESRAKVVSKNGDKIQTEACLGAIQKNLDQFDCTLIPRFLISGADLQSEVKVQVKSRSKKSEKMN